MLTISKPLSASQAQTYHVREFVSQEQNYWSRDQQGHSEWQGRLAEQWGLQGCVGSEHFARLSEGQHPHTEEQLVRHQVSRTYEGKFGRDVTSVEHRAGWDATFSAPKSVSLTALVGGDDRVREAHREGVSVFREEMRSFSVGDRIQFTAPANDLRVANRELGIIESIDEYERLRLKMDGGRAVELDPHRHPHLDHGYAMTSHSSQGQTANRVLIHVDTELVAKDLLNSRMAYVSVSRGAHDAQIFTNDREKLPAALVRDISRQSVHVPEINSEQRVVPQQEISTGRPQERGMGLGIGL